MKLIRRDGWDFLYLNAHKDCSCPFASTTIGGEMYCGSWCPLFDLRERDRIPQVDAPDKVRLEVRLHCGAGTRVIEVETSEKEGA